MSSVAELYTKEMRKKYGMVYAAWKLGNHYELGDYGVLRGNVFRRLGNVKDLGFTFDILKDPTPSNESFKSTGVSSNKITAAGGIAAGNVSVDVGISIEFAKAHTVFYEAQNVYTNKISNVAGLGAKIKKLYLSRESANDDVMWKKDYVVITELDVAESATIFISNTDNTKIDLQAAAKDIPLVVSDPRLGWSLNSDRGLDSYIIASKGATPLFQLASLKRKGGLDVEIAFHANQEINTNQSIQAENHDLAIGNEQSPSEEEYDFVKMVDETWTV